MGYKKEYKPEQTINGTWGQIWYDGQILAQCFAFKLEINIKSETISQCMKMADGSKATGIEIKGELKLHHVNSFVMKKYANSIKKGKTPKAKIISKLKDPDALGTERVVAKGCLLDKLILADWEAGKMGEESYTFTAEDYDILESITK